MSVIVTVDLRVDPARIKEFMQFGGGLLKDTMAFDGCQKLDVWLDQDIAGGVMFYEIWDTRQHYERYFAWRQENGTLDQIGAFLTAPPVIRYFDNSRDR